MQESIKLAFLFMKNRMRHILSNACTIVMRTNIFRERVDAIDHVNFTAAKLSFKKDTEVLLQ